MKRCSSCGEVKQLREYRWRTEKNTYYGRCTACLQSYQKEYKSRPSVKASASSNRARWQAEKMRFERSTLGDEYIKKLLVQKTTLSWSSIPDYLVQLKRLQINIQRFLKDHHAKHDRASH